MVGLLHPPPARKLDTNERIIKPDFFFEKVIILDVHMFSVNDLDSVNPLLNNGLFL